VTHIDAGADDCRRAAAVLRTALTRGH